MAHRLLRSPLLRALGTCIGVVLLLHGVDLGATLRSLANADLGWLALAMLLTAVAYALSVVEWGALLRAAAPRVGWGRVTSWQVQSVFLGCVVPGGAGGDALRALHAVRAAGRGRGLASLLCSRMAGSVGMASWALLGALLLQGSFGWPVVLASAVLVLLIAVGWLLAMTAAPRVRCLQAHSLCVVRRAAGLAAPLTDALRGFRDHPRALGWSVASGVAGWTVNLLSLVALARAVGVAEGPQLFAVAIPLSLLTTVIPFAVNGIGLREGVLVGLLVHAGVDAHRAAAVALLVDLQPLPVALCGAALWLTGRTRTQRDESRRDEGAATAPAAA
jgi:uncharacterized protein (TIRG00374 family)